MAARVDRKVLLGVVQAAHGVRGEVRIRSFCAEPADIGSYGPLSDETGTRRFTVRPTGMSGKGDVLARVDGVSDRDAAEALRGLRLYAPRAALPPPEAGEWYEDDLIGLAARGPDGRDWGTVLALHDFGAGTILELSGGGHGRAFMVPFNATAVPAIDVDGGTVTVDPPAGLLDDGRKGED
ncbi:ribosome maturation factor RimM [Vineibacter terrae]|uniref:ribosome maturation factor RimM n=1 Tax=Vineibacter terrae TaxID=2586908 RepID=UPI002E2F9F45|nr:ribosome maturation factor RimM [Vineibacter terrae]HEX2885118.1 ribosome maturation factor RimM [Vineibacter terrae]